MSAISCDEVLADLERYVDGELDPSRTAALSNHLKGCRPCFGHAEFRRRFKDLVHAKWGMDAPEELIKRVTRSIAEAGRRSSGN